MIDTHAHLNFSPLLDQIDEIVRKSRQSGLEGIIIASSSLADSKKAVELAQKYPGFLYTSVGIHPQKTDPDNQTSIQEQLLQLENLIKKFSPLSKKSTIVQNLEKKRVLVAIGECGLDFGPVAPGEEARSRQEQEQLFVGQIRLALKYGLPLIIHARKANDELIEILEDEIRSLRSLKLETRNLPRGVFHCYSGGKRRVEKILNLPGQWYFGFDGNLTYDQGLQQVLKIIPKDRVLLETDAPFLAPEPYRGQTCYPYYLPLIAQKAAEIWKVEVERVKRQTLQNSRRFFNF